MRLCGVKWPFCTAKQSPVSHMLLQFQQPVVLPARLKGEREPTLPARALRAPQIEVVPVPVDPTGGEVTAIGLPSAEAPGFEQSTDKKTADLDLKSIL